MLQISGGYVSSGGEDEDYGVVKTAKTDRAISFWDETGKHETMQVHLDMDILDIPGMRVSSAKQEDQELRKAEHVYKEALGGLLDLHRNLLQSLPKSRSSSHGYAGFGKRSISGKKPATNRRSRSVLPTLTNLDAMQDVYSDIKGFDRKSHSYDDMEMITGFSGWETEDTADQLPALRNRSLPSPKKSPSRRRQVAHTEDLQAQNGGRTATPTISTQVLDFDSGSAIANMNKTKMRERSVRSRRRTQSPGADGRHLKINFRVEELRSLPRTPSAASDHLQGWHPEHLA